jgi:hypothetical protein
VEGGLKVMSMRTGCGLIEARFVLKYNGSEMTVVIKDIPGDAGNFILKELPFSPGVFEVNLQGRSMQSCTLVHKPIVSDYKLNDEELWRINNADIVQSSR